MDPLGARVGGAAVKLLAGEQVIKEDVSDAQGNFALEGIAEGRYRIQVSAAGFRTRITDPVFVAGGARVSVDVALPIGPLEESVSVTSAATDVLPSQTGAPVTVLEFEDARTARQDRSARSVAPRTRLCRSSRRRKGGVTSMFVRGGNSNFNKVLIDGIPANDIGGGIDLAQFSRPAWIASKCFASQQRHLRDRCAGGRGQCHSRRGRDPRARGDHLAGRRQFRPNHESASVGRHRGSLRLLQRVRAPRHRQRSRRTTSIGTRHTPAASAGRSATTPT